MSTVIEMYDIFYEKKDVDQFFTEIFHYNGDVKCGTWTFKELNVLIDKSERLKREMRKKLTEDQYDQAADKMIEIRQVYRKSQENK